MSGLLIPGGPQSRVTWQESGIGFITAQGQQIPGTFTRNSKAWLGGMEYPPHTARTVDYAGGKIVLMEGGRTNLHPSGEFTSTGATISCTAAYRNTPGPLPNSLATTVQFAAVDRARFQYALGSPAAGTYTVSLWVRHISGGKNFSLGVTEAVPGAGYLWKDNLVASSTWQRFSFTLNLGGNPAYFVFGNRDAATPGTFEVYGAQLELSPFATSYIPTTTGQVTRQAEYWSAPLHALIATRPAFTIATAVNTPGVRSTGAAIWEFRSNDSAERFGLWRNTDSLNNIRLVRSGQSGTINIAGGPSTLKAWITTHLVFDGLASLTCYANGAKIWTVNWGDGSFPYDTLWLGNLNAGDYASGWIAPGAPALAIPFIRPWALTPADIAAEDARWKAALDAVTLPAL